MNISDNFFIKQPNQLSIDEEYFCLIDNADFIDDNQMPRKTKLDDSVLAKKVKLSDQQLYKYYVRMGFDQKLYNPVNALSASKNYTSLQRNSELNKFKVVGESAFNYYIMYLSTKNNIWLIKAEREVV